MAHRRSSGPLLTVQVPSTRGDALLAAALAGSAATVGWLVDRRR